MYSKTHLMMRHRIEFDRPVSMTPEEFLKYVPDDGPACNYTIKSLEIDGNKAVVTIYATTLWHEWFEELGGEEDGVLYIPVT